MPPRADSAGPHGILVVDKPRGPTSHDIVAQARRHFQTRRVGHAGTLDPMATGVLVLLFGEATKLCDWASGCDKRYSAELRFGRATDSHDAEGATTEELPGPLRATLDELELTRALSIERARTIQLPPVVSALKVGGQRAYRLSRAGTPPELQPRPVRVHSLELQDWDQHHACVELLVTKGYYVRAFARDVASTLGIPAHLGGLRRLQSGDFNLAEACSWPLLEERLPMPLAAALPRLLPTLRLKDSGVSRARLGQTLTPEDFLDPPTGQPNPDLGGGVWGWTDSAGTPIAIGERKMEGFGVRRGFTAEPSAPERLQRAGISAG